MPMSAPFGTSASIIDAPAARPQAVGSLDLSVLVLTLNEADNVRVLLPKLHRAVGELTSAYEVLVVDGGSTDETASAARALGARVIVQALPGYGHAFRQGVQQAQGEYILMLDADLSHDPDFIYKLWTSRERADIVIASRYTRGGVACMPWLRKVLSRVLNRWFSQGLALDVRDCSSGFRCCRASVLKAMPLQGADFDVLPEMVVRARVGGWRIAEVPFTYFPRHRGSSHARIVRVGINLAKTFARMWRLRNSISAADYDERAFYSLIPIQRFWQRERHRIITGFARGGGRILDVGCGSSVIMQSLNYAIGMDIGHHKMRHLSRYGLPLVTASAFALPFQDASMDCVISSEVIEHIPVDPSIFLEMDRVLRPGGRLILGTPDYATWSWPAIEWLYHTAVPGGYVDEHMSHYTRSGMHDILRVMGYELLGEDYVFGSELIICARKSAKAPPSSTELARVLPETQHAH